MEDEPNLRRLVMKKAAGGKTPLISPSTAPLISQNHSGFSQHEHSKTSHHAHLGYHSEPLVEQIGPDFSKLSRELNRVVLKIQHQADTSDCPMHNHETESRRGSRAHDPGYVRRRSQELNHQEHRRSLSGSLQSSGSRLGSRDTLIHRGSLNESQYQSLPRRLNKEPPSSKVDRRQSFQDYKAFRDKFTGKLEFKDTLRTEQKQTTRERDRDRENRDRSRRGRPYSEAAHDRGSGYLIESDFDFRSPPSTRDNSRDRKPRFEFDDTPRRGASSDVYASPRRGKEDIYAAPRTRSQDPYTPPQRPEEIYASSRTKPDDPYASPRRKELRIVVGDQTKRSNNDLRGHSSPLVRSPVYEQDNPFSHKDPLSPRRVEFADEVFGFKSSRPGSRCESPVPKSILRHTNSDAASTASTRPAAHVAVRSSTADLSLITTANRPTTLIIPTDGSASFSTQHFNNQISINHHNQYISQTADPREPEKESHTRKISINSSESQQKQQQQQQQQYQNDENEDAVIGESSDVDQSEDQNGQLRSSEYQNGQLRSSEHHNGQLRSSEHQNGQLRSSEHQNGQLRSSEHQNGQLRSSEHQNGHDVDSDETLTEDPKTSRERGSQKKKRVMGPPLADWNRSQSFPQHTGQLTKQDRKSSDPGQGGLGLSTLSLDSHATDFSSVLDLVRTLNSSLRTRVGDLEQQTVDNNNEIKCLKATLAECLRRIDCVENHIRHCPVNAEDESSTKRRHATNDRRHATDDESYMKRRPVSATGVYSALEQRGYERRGSYATRS